MFIDKNNLLCQSQPTNKTKEYKYIIDGYNIQDFDKPIYIYHKKQIKIINFKDLGDKMAVFYINQHPTKLPTKLNTKSFILAFNLYPWFDEETGTKYGFLPKFSHHKIDTTNTILTKLKQKTSLQNTDKWICSSIFQDDFQDIDYISFLFGLTLLFGKFDIKNNDLKSAKFHLPIFGQHIFPKDLLTKIQQQLQKQWIFIQTSYQETNDGETIQITITDYQILQSFAKFLLPIENINKISKYEYTKIAKTKLLDFLSTETQNFKQIKLLTK